MKIGNLYAGYRTDRPYIEFYSLVFFIRRSLFIVISFTLLKYPGIQLMVFLQLNVFYIIFVGYMNYYKRRKHKTMELFNEILLLTISYHLLILYHIVTKESARDQLGTSIVVIMSFLLAVNIMLISIKVRSKLSKKVKIKYYQNKIARIMRRKEEAREHALNLQLEANFNYVRQ